MEFNKKGFLYPIVDNAKCNNCKICEKVCPIENYNKIKNEPLKIFAAWNKNDSERILSTSGGVFFAIAKEVIRKNGIVFGVSFDNNWLCHHKTAENLEQLKEFQGSKYTQSDTRQTYKQAKNYLNDGKLVYYTGTPCQIAGLTLFLGKKYQNLLTSDLICHGVPSSLEFKKEILYFEKKYKQKIKNLYYRSKYRFGWGCDISIEFTNGKCLYKNSLSSPYFKRFWYNQNLRECCYNCPFRTVNRIGDITLADFWGIKKIFPKIKTAKGISRLLVNTDKGLNFLKNLTDLESLEVTLEKANHGLMNKTIKIRNIPRFSIEKEAIKNFIKTVTFWKWRK